MVDDDRPDVAMAPVLAGAEQEVARDVAALRQSGVGRGLGFLLEQVASSAFTARAGTRKGAFTRRLTDS